MAKADEYYRYARECVAAADEAQSEHERNQFLNMARAWTRAALLVERASPISIDAIETGPYPSELSHKTSGDRPMHRSRLGQRAMRSSLFDLAQFSIQWTAPG
jgi:hypothetical protein